MEKEIDIKGTLSKSNDVFFFTASIPLIINSSAQCHSKAEASGSALFTAIFELPWVFEVAVEGRALIVKKGPASASWEEHAPEVAEVIRRLHHQHIPFFSEAYLKTMAENEKSKKLRQPVPYKINETNISSDLGISIQKILDQFISPSLASHGGQASMVDLHSGKVYIYFSGGCQGCSQASVTVKEGIEKLLLKEFPQLNSVADITDHSLGTNPYFP